MSQLPDNTFALANELDRNLAHHEMWVDRVNRGFVCALPAEADVTAPDSHCRCRLGHWLAGEGKSQFGTHPRYWPIVTAHRSAHDAARNLASQTAGGQQITVAEYDAFQAWNQELRHEIKSILVLEAQKVMGADPLTGANNRLMLKERLGEHIAATRADRTTACLILMDLDHFKKINDGYGHPVGDRVLAGVAQCVTARIRACDLFFRYGGEEFLICLNRADLDTAVMFCERLRAAISACEFHTEDGVAFGVTASFGVVPLHPRLAVDEAIYTVDKALYEAKQNGRDRVETLAPRAA